MRVKFMAVVAAMVLSLAVPMNVSAANKYDVNGDGEANMVDSLVVHKFLLGLGSVPDVSKLDVNGDKMVTRLDMDCIDKYVMLGTTCTWNYVRYYIG
ncbi:MAG: hypothetical protein K2I93_02635 [Oscillospiraceae bacterium]|nr:hypothetical protein [Oscillospiraceae bacterium]